MEAHSGSPTHFYSLAFCVHMIAYVISLIGAFTPEWSTVTESTGGVNGDPYDKGVIVSCKHPQGPTGCGFNKDISGSSTLFFASFLVVIAFILVGFFNLQLLVAGLCVRSLRERNLGIPLLIHFTLLILLTILAVVLFEVSITEDISPGNDYEEHTFGLSRYAVLAAMGLYFICTFFALAEYFKRKGNNSVDQDRPAVVMVDSIPPTPKSKSTNDDETISNNNSNNNIRNDNNDSRLSTNSTNILITKDNDGKDSSNQRKFSKRENRPPSAFKYEDFSNKNFNTPKRASTSIIPLQGLNYYR